MSTKKMSTKKMKNFKNFLNEASFSRLWQHTKDERIAYAIITAHRSERTSAENKSRNRQMGAEIRAKGFGFVKLDGFWIENEGTPEEAAVKEDSFFITAQENQSGELKGLIRSLVKKYQQEAAVFRPSNSKGGKAILILNDLKEINLGSIRFSKAGSIYSRMRGKPNQTFVFEKFIRPNQNWLAALKNKKVSN